MSKDIDLGHDHVFHPTVYKDDFSGGIIDHKKPDGSDCSGHISFANRAWANAFDNKITTWDLVSEDPLTISPSVLCLTCGDHGFIQEGKWVPA